MCYAIPGKVVQINNSTALIDYFGERKTVLADLVDIEVGDYIYAQGGVAINKIPADEADLILKYWRDQFIQLQMLDKVHTLNDVSGKADSEFLSLLQKFNQGKTVSKEEMGHVLGSSGENEIKALSCLANNVRQRQHGNSSCIHGILEFSNTCQNNCYYCGIRCSNEIERYRMSVSEIVETAKVAVSTYNFKALVIQSGEDYHYDDEILVDIVTRLRALNILVFISIGQRSLRLYQKLYLAGARASLLRFETSNSKIFRDLRPGTDLINRLNLIKSLKKMGYIIATGFMIGLPGETQEDLVNNILLTKELEPEMYSFGPLIPTINTPLAGIPRVDVSLVLKIIALTRLVVPDSNILVTTALETLDYKARKKALLAGANSMMINVTPSEQQRKYCIYNGKNCLDKNLGEQVVDAVRLLYSLGRAPTDLGLYARNK